MITSDFRKLFPKIYQDGQEPAMLALAGKMNTIFRAIEDDIKALATIHDPCRCPSWLLADLGHHLNANLQNTDSETTKRRKIETAISGHKNSGTWLQSVKTLIDSIIGGDSQIVTYVGFDDDVDCGAGDEPAAYYWSGEGGEDAGLPYGVYEYGEGLEEGVKGVIKIDIDDSALTPAEVDDLKLQLRRHVASYMIVFLGYRSAGLFVAYANGMIR